MLQAIFTLFTCQLTGEALARGLGLPVPGPVLGMLFMVVGLHVWRSRQDSRAEVSLSRQPQIDDTPLGIAAAFLLSHLSLLFVPAGVGIISHLKTLSVHGLGLAIALLVSTALSLAMTAIVFGRLSKVFEKQTASSSGDSQ
jgi:holin-like protein